jgi:hypothetical protein
MDIWEKIESELQRLSVKTVIGELRILNASKLDKGLVLNARHSSPHSIIK